MVRPLTCDSRGREFNSRPSRCQVTTLGKLLTHMCLIVTKQYNLVPVARHRNATTFSKLGGPIPWSRLLYRTKYGWYTQFCALLRKTLGWSVQLLGGPDPSNPPSGCALELNY